VSGSTGREVTLVVSAATLGVLAVVLPVWPSIGHSDLFAVVQSGFNGLSALGVLLLGSAGYTVGRFESGLPPWVLGFATTAAFPVIAIADMMFYQTQHGHRLWPLEFVAYGFLGLPGVIGAYTASRGRRGR
jgi:hypothetical protein